MEYIRMNADVAKKIGAFPHKNIKKHVTPGVYVVDCSTGMVSHLKTPDIIDEFCDRYVGNGVYYKILEPTKTAIEAHVVNSEIRRIEQELDNLKSIQNNQCGDIQKSILNTAKSMVCLFLYRNENYDMKVDEVVLRPEDKLVCFGCRFPDTRGSLWIALVEITGILTDTVRRYYEVNNGSTKYARIINDTIKHCEAKRMESTGYRPGESFVKSCSSVKLNT